MQKKLNLFILVSQKPSRINYFIYKDRNISFLNDNYKHKYLNYISKIVLNSINHKQDIYFKNGKIYKKIF